MTVQPERYNNWQEKRKQDISYCGCIHHFRDYHRGKGKTWHKPCNEPDCLYCGPRIQKEMSEMLGIILEDRPVRIVELTGTKAEINKARAKIVRKYGKEKIFAAAEDYQTDEGWETKMQILVDTDDEIGKEYDTLCEDDIQRWSQKSCSIKKSGHLIRKVAVSPIKKDNSSDDPFEEVYPVETEELILDTKDQDLVHKIDEQACQDTSHLDPKTLTELEEAVKVRQKRFEELLAENEIVILSKEVRIITVNMTKVRWKGLNPASD